MHAFVSTAAVRLKADPDWAGAAQVLIDGCARAADAAQRVELLERLCDALGTQLYPAFLKVLCVIAERATPPAQAGVAEALVEALRSGRMPSGRRAAWGAVAGAAARADRSTAQALGPIEFLCAWQAQPDDADVLGAVAFDRTLRALLGLVSQSDAARSLYCARLRAVADDPLSGTLTRSTRGGLRALAASWEQRHAELQAPVDAFLGARGGSSLRSLSPAAWSAPALPAA